MEVRNRAPIEASLWHNLIFTTAFVLVHFGAECKIEDGDAFVDESYFGMEVSIRNFILDMNGYMHWLQKG